MGSEIRIEYRRVAKRFSGRRPGEAGVTAVENVSLAIADREVVALIGPSGCGKSTLLNMGAGLSLPTAGEVYVDGVRVDAPNAHVAFMLQKDLLLPWRTIRANVELGLQIRGMRARDRHARAQTLLARCHLAGFESHYPHQLSGGMRQRAALARTLAVDPTVLLMDEPFSALDAQTKMVLQQDLAQMLAEEGKTALLITHDLGESIVLADRILVMSARPGRIVEEIRVDLPHRADTMKRRRDPRVTAYVTRLMDLLRIENQAAGAAA